MRCILSVFLCISLFFVAAVDANAGPVVDKILKRGELIVGTSADNPPMSMKTKDGKIIGFDVDVSQLIASAMGVKLKLVQIEFNKLIDALNEGNIDMIISNMTIHPQRNLKVAFIGPYYISGMTLLTTSNLARDIRNLKDIKGETLKVAVSKGTTNEMMAKENISTDNIIITKSEDEAIKMLLDGKTAGVLTDGGAALVAAYKHKDKKLILSQPLTFEPIGIAVPANDILLLNFLDNYITTLKNQKRFEEIFNKWVEDPAWVKDLQ